MAAWWSEVSFLCFLPVVQGADFIGKSTGTQTVSVLQINSSSSYSLSFNLRIENWLLSLGKAQSWPWNLDLKISLCFTLKNKRFWVYSPQSACLNLSRYGQPRHSELFFQMVWRMCEFKEGDLLMQCLLHFTKENRQTTSHQSERWHCGHHHLKFIKTSFRKQVWNIKNSKENLNKNQLLRVFFQTDFNFNYLKKVNYSSLYLINK